MFRFISDRFIDINNWESTHSNIRVWYSGRNNFKKANIKHNGFYSNLKKLKQIISENKKY